MKSSLTQLHTEPCVTEREWSVDGLPVLTASVSVPQPVPLSGGITRRILRFYRLQAHSYLRYCERCLFPQAKAEYEAALAASAPLPCFRADLNYQITYNEGGLWSLYTQSRETTLSGSPLLIRHADTWDLAAGFPAPIHAFFSPRTRWKPLLIASFTQQIEQQERAGISVYHADWRKQLRRRFNARNFYLTTEGLACFYPMYAIAPAVEGIPTFLLPYSDIEPISAAPSA